MKALLILALVVTGIIDIITLEFEKGFCCLGIATILLEL